MRDREKQKLIKNKKKKNIATCNSLALKRSEIFSINKNSHDFCFIIIIT